MTGDPQVSAQDEQLITRIEAVIGRAKPSTVAEWRHCCNRYGVRSASATGVLMQAVRDVWGERFSNYAWAGELAVTIRTGRADAKRLFGRIVGATFFHGEPVDALTRALEAAP